MHPNLLKIHAPSAPEVVRPNLEDVCQLNELCRQFSQATGWPLRYIAGPQPDLEIDLVWSAPVNPGVGTPPGHLRIDLGGLQPDAVDLEAAIELAEGLLRMWTDMQRTRLALWQREAELAASVPVVTTTGEARRFAEKLDNTIRLGAEAIGCHAAALYLLDDYTSVLKMRSAWGLSPTRLAEPARPLSTALADLEALLGHAVALESIDPLGPWNAPEEFPAAVCVPVASDNTVLGTLWLFCNRERPFTDEQTNIAELVAGRVAAELERESLLREGLATAAESRQTEVVAERQRTMLPHIAPPVERLEVAGMSVQAERLGGAFHDWFVLDDGRLAVMVGYAEQRGLPGAMSAATLRAALRSHAAHCPAPQDVLRAVNQTLWTTSSGDQPATLLYAVIDPRNGQTILSAAGGPSALLMNSRRCESLVYPSEPLGQQPDLILTAQRRLLLPGESLLLYGGNRYPVTAASLDRPLDGAMLAPDLLQRLEPSFDRPAAETVKRLCELMSEVSLGDYSALAIHCIGR